ncbi:hypothetical protein LCGC14_2199500, partial [marine sediment metagenome]
QYGTRVYDGHPANAANKFALGMLAHMMSRNVPWVQFITSDVRLMKDDNVKKYLQGAADQIHAGLNESDLYGQSVWFAKDATVIGTGVNIPEENEIEGKMHYETIHPKNAFLQYDRWGNLIVVHRPIQITALDSMIQFDKSKLPAKLLRDAKGEGQGNPFAKYEYLMGMYKNPKPDPNSERSEEKSWKVFFVLLKGQGQGKKNRLVQHSGTDLAPNAWTYGREPGINYGTSIAADALTEGLQANKLGELMLILAHREADPSLIVPQALEHKLQTMPGGRTFVPERYTGKDVIQETLSRGKWQIDDAQSDRIHATIDDKFFVPLWDALMTLQGPQKTLGEVLQIQGNKAILLSPVSESFECQYLLRVVDNQWFFEESIAGRMPDVPDILLEPKNRNIKTIFIGPLAQLQRATAQTRGTINALAVIQEIAGMWPSSLVKINEMELIEEAALSQGMKQSLIRSDEEVKAILQAQAAKEQAELEAQQLTDAAKVVPGLGKAVEQGSPLELAGVGA